MSIRSVWELYSEADGTKGVVDSQQALTTGSRASLAFPLSACQN